MRTKNREARGLMDRMVHLCPILLPLLLLLLLLLSLLLLHVGPERVSLTKVPNPVDVFVVPPDPVQSAPRQLESPAEYIGHVPALEDSSMEPPHI